jgi:hypothetical protein
MKVEKDFLLSSNSSQSHVVSGTEEWNSASPFLPRIPQKATKVLTVLTSNTDSGQTTKGVPHITPCSCNFDSVQMECLRCLCYPLGEGVCVVCLRIFHTRSVRSRILI